MRFLFALAESVGLSAGGNSTCEKRWCAPPGAHSSLTPANADMLTCNSCFSLACANRAMWSRPDRLPFYYIFRIFFFFLWHMLCCCCCLFIRLALIRSDIGKCLRLFFFFFLKEQFSVHVSHWSQSLGRLKLNSFIMFCLHGSRLDTIRWNFNKVWGVKNEVIASTKQGRQKMKMRVQTQAIKLLIFTPSAMKMTALLREVIRKIKD